MPAAAKLCTLADQKVSSVTCTIKSNLPSKMMTVGKSFHCCSTMCRQRKRNIIKQVFPFSDFLPFFVLMTLELCIMSITKEPLRIMLCVCYSKSYPKCQLYFLL